MTSTVALNRPPATGPFHWRFERTLRVAWKSLANSETLGAELVNGEPTVPSAHTPGMAALLPSQLAQFCAGTVVP